MSRDPLAWWTRDRRVSSWVFMGCTLLNVFLLCVGVGIKSQEWFWLVAFPVMAAGHFKSILPDWTSYVLVVFNPWLYGLMGWGVWRMWKLTNSKPPEG